MLLDEVLPEFDMRASYGTRVQAPPERVYASIRSANLNHWGLTRTLVLVRGAPGLLAAPRQTWRRLGPQVGRHRIRLEDVLSGGFTLLGERPGEEVVLGTVGRFWLARGDHGPVSLERFLEGTAPGPAKAAWNFAVQAGRGRGAVLTTETRVLCADPATRQRFRIYWALIRPFSGLIRREMLAAICATAEAESHDHPPGP
jgi:hypothetical protein